MHHINDRTGIKEVKLKCDVWPQEIIMSKIQEKVSEKLLELNSKFWGNSVYQIFFYP